MPIIAYRGKKPKIDTGAFIMSSATLLGDVVLSSNVLILANAVLRGDFSRIYIGENVCVQENSVLNPTLDDQIRIEGHAIIGYGAKIHGAEIKKGVFIGMNSIILPGVEVGESSIIAAGSILTANMKIPPRSLVVGAPAKIVRELNDEDVEWVENAVARYMEILGDYKNELGEWEIRYAT